MLLLNSKNYSSFLLIWECIFLHLFLSLFWVSILLVKAFKKWLKCDFNSVVDHSALTNAKPSNNSGNWVLVPNRFGLMHRVNMDDEMSQVQPFFLAEQDVSFELYTLKNQNTPQILSTENITTITSSNFNKKVPTRIYIHGWQERFGSMKKCLNDGKFDTKILQKRFFLLIRIFSLTINLMTNGKLLLKKPKNKFKLQFL